MAVHASRNAELAGEVEEKVRVVEVVLEPRHARAVEGERGDRANRLAVGVLVPVEQQPASPVQARLDPRRRLGERALGEARVEEGARLRIGEALEAEEHAEE